MTNTDLLNDIEYMSLNISRAFEDIDTLRVIDTVNNSNRVTDTSKKLTKIAVESIANTLGVNLNVSLEDFSSAKKVTVDFISRIIKSILEGIRWIGKKIMELFYSIFGILSNPVKRVSENIKEALYESERIKKINIEKIDILIEISMMVSNIYVGKERYLDDSKYPQITLSELSNGVDGVSFLDINHKEIPKVNHIKKEDIKTICLRNHYMSASLRLKKVFKHSIEIFPKDIINALEHFTKLFNFLSNEYATYISNIVNIINDLIFTISKCESITDVNLAIKKSIDILSELENRLRKHLISLFPDNEQSEILKGDHSRPLGFYFRTVKLPGQYMVEFFTSKNLIIPITTVGVIMKDRDDNLEPYMIPFKDFTRDNLLEISKANSKVNDLFKNSNIKDKYKKQETRITSLVINLSHCYDNQTTIGEGNNKELVEIINSLSKVISTLGVINNSNAANLYRDISYSIVSIDGFIKTVYTKPIKAINNSQE